MESPAHYGLRKFYRVLARGPTDLSLALKERLFRHLPDELTCRKAGPQGAAAKGDGCRGLGGARLSILGANWQSAKKSPDLFWRNTVDLEHLVATGSAGDKPDVARAYP
jgi:hypothetical protein